MQPTRSGTRRRRWASPRPRRTGRPAGGWIRRCPSRRLPRRSRRPPRPRCHRTSRPAPGTGRGGCGSDRRPSSRCDEPMANSSRLVLPMMTAPAAVSRSTTVASYGGRQPSRIRDEQVVGTPRVHRLSFSATGTPASGPGSSPAATRASIGAAAWRASSASTRLKACTSPSRSAMRARWSSTTSAAVADRTARRRGDRDRRAAGASVGVVMGPRRGSAAPGSGRTRRPAPRPAPRRGRGSGPTTSSRSTFCSGRGCVIGTTSSRSSASMSRKWSSIDASCSV